ncbi:MAG TPA: phage tail protein [Candidatus Limnocylindrales bacterium]|jgi:microcystin-dependent protein|nr:phage tail protein [Candidatus Limnocylindrales bacterium]
MRVIPLLLGIALALSAQAETVPSLINYQGRLTDETGRALTNGTYGIQFRLWNKPVAGQPGETLVWGQQYEVSLVNGVFNVILGPSGGAPIPGAGVTDLQFAFGESERYFGLTLVRLQDGTVVSEGQRKEILPRQQILSGPFALHAGDGNPPGTIVAFGGTNVPAGWFLCDGRALKSGEYPRLFAAVLTMWGDASDDGDPATDFRVPDFRGLFLRGVDDSPLRGSANRDPGRNSERGLINPGSNIGNQVGSYQGDSFSGHSHSAGGLRAAMAQLNGGLHWRVSESAPFVANQAAGFGFVNVSYPVNVSVEIFGSSGTPDTASSYTGFLENRSKNAYVNYIIKY